MRRKIGISGALLSLIVSLISCGGGDGAVPASAPSARLDGTVTDAVITNGTLRVYEFDNGQQGSLLAKTTTDGKGDFVFEQFTSPDRPIVIEVRDGRYTEEASGVSVELLDGQALRAYMFYEQGSAITVQITPLTHLASCLADYKIGHGINVNNAITEAASIFSGLAGIDILGTRPLDITDPDNANFEITDSLRYGTILAAISSFTAEVSAINGVTPHRFNQNSSIYATQVLCQDIASDGVFNGLGFINNGNSVGQLSLGSVALNADTFRNTIAQNILSIISSDRNNTGLGIDDFVLYANEIASSTDAIYGGVPATGVDQEGPVSTAVLPPDSFIKGIDNLSFNVTDPIGLKSVQFEVNGLLNSNAQIANPILSLNTTNYTDGNITITVVATDVLNNQSRTDFNYVIDNTSPIIALTSSKLVNNKSYTASGTYEAQGSPVTSIMVNGVNAAINTTLNTWSADITLLSGDNIVTVQITDAVGNGNSVDVAIGVDLIKPLISSFNTLATFTTYQGQLNLCTSGQITPTSGNVNPVCLSTDNVNLNGAALDGSLQNLGYALLGFSPTDPQGAGVFTSQENLRVEYKYELNNSEVIGWTTAPKAGGSDLFYYFPMVTEYLGSNWFHTTTTDAHKVTFRAVDEAGNFSELIYEIRFDVLIPELVVTPSINSALFTNNNYATRFAIDGSLLDVNYSFTSSPSSSIYIALTDYANHSLAHNYDTAVKQNFVRVINQTEHQFKGGSDPEFSALSSVYRGDGSTLSKISVNSTGVYVQKYTDVPPEPSGTTAWTFMPNAEVCNNNPVVLVADTLFGPVTSFSTFNSNSALTGNYGASFGVYSQGKTFSCIDALNYTPTWNSNLFPPVYSSTWAKRAHVFNDYKPGYPSVLYVNQTNQSSFSTENIFVYNDSLGMQILPTSGWYHIPPNTNIIVQKKVRLPVVGHFTDSEVIASAEFTSYVELAIDNHLIWSIDTDLVFDRVVDTGSVANLSAATKTTDTIGLGIVAFTIAR